MLIFEGKEISTDSEGYLKETAEWSEPLAVTIAEKEGITLSPEHWEVVRFVRDFYLEFNTSPAIRMLVKAMANKATAATCIACFRKARQSRQRRLLACLNR